MKTVITAASLVGLILVGPAIAAEKKNKNAASSQDGAEGRGGLAKWPVLESPADWSSAAPSSASSGASTGASSGSGASGTTGSSEAGQTQQ